MRIPLLLSISVLALAACGGTSETPAKCGDGIVSGDEACDDGNTIDGDQCNNHCELSECGDNVVDFNEACDDGNTIDGDGCDSNCTQSFCGNGITAPDEECDDGNTTSGDGCDANCVVSACGNGAVASTEQCDDGNLTDGDGCDSNCKTTACGNGIKTGAEQCDDGNSVSADGCSSNCNVETLEMEPNEDGQVSTGGTQVAGNDFSITAADANGAITASRTITGALSPAGDEDVFKVTNTGTTAVFLGLDTWNLATGFGIGTPCGSSIDTGINVRTAAGAALVTSNDRSSTDRCAGLVYALFPNTTVYVHVTENGDNAVVASYALEIVFRPVVCGDGAVGPGEQCDDSNTTAGDGCSATCQIENAFLETEPNEDGMPSTGGTGINGNDFSAANANGPITTSQTVLASLSPLGDEDVFAISNPGTLMQQVNLDTWNMAPGFGVGISCGGAIDTAMHVRDASGNSIVSNDNRAAADQCSTITTSLAPGQTRYVHVSELGDNGSIPSYALKIKFTPVVCGDMSVGPGEQCDDGNTMSGDGCDSVCQIEPICGDSMLQPTEQCDDGNTMTGDGCDAMCQLENSVAEMEPNEDGTPQTGGSGIAGNDFSVTNADMNTTFTGSVTLAARLDPNGDEDVFKFTNPGTTYAIVTFDTWNTAPGFGIGVSCGTAGIDTGITLRNAAAASQASNNDRSTSDRCSTVSYNLPPGGTIYAHVVENGDNAPIARYALKVAYAPVVCGDNMVGPGEQCDDGNTMTGDGCDAVCIKEPVCGNSMLENAEQCDDGNTTAGDNCSSTCQLENAVTESEPNEDGTPQTGGTTTVGNDFSIVNANGPITTTTRIAARITPAGDEDVFKITNPGSTIAILTLNTYNLAPGFGFGVSCGNVIDTAVHLRDAMGTSLASNDDRSSSPADWCSSLTYNLAPGASVYAHVIERGDDAAIASYALAINLAPVVCGDGTIGPGETCDDGNTGNGDGCSATCHLEGAVSETEPNEDGTPSTGGSTTTGNDFSSANANGPFSSTTTITATLVPTGDEDVFAFTTPGTTAATLTLDVWNLAQNFGIGVPCASSIDTAMHVRDASGTSLALNDNRSSTDKCSALTYVLAPGQTVYVHISENGDNAQIASYALVATVVPTVCGDGVLGPGEQCDDGNTTPGDGCSASCRVPAEVEPNDTAAQATSSTLQVTGDALIGGAITAVGDKDVYRVTVAAPTVVRFETFTAPNDCATVATIDLRLLDSVGTEIVADTTGAGIAGCGAIVMPLAAGTYFIQVEEKGNNATIPSYMLEVAFQDDVGIETEPNETFSAASVNLLGETDSFVFGDHMLSTDVDVYSIVVPPGKGLRAEIIEGDRAVETCEDFEVDSKIFLLDQNGTSLDDDDDAGRGFCSKLDGTGPSPVDPTARNTGTTDKTFYIRVESHSTTSITDNQFVYRLQVTIR